MIKSAIIGHLVGDALGVPVEFKSRAYLRENPVTDMIGFGAHHQPAGTWSDDGSLTLCLADSLCNGYDLEDIATKFLQWYNTEIWTPHGTVFDIGITTRQAIYNISLGKYKPELCGGFDENDNGNGSLMRILPLVFYLKNESDLNEIYTKINEVSSITHGHFRSVFACFVYVIYAKLLLEKKSKHEAYNELKTIINNFANIQKFNEIEVSLFNRILKNDISILDESEINSSGYVLDSLEVAFWCLLTSDTYEETVLKAVNLGRDTDTSGAITGGLAGILYGFEAIPKHWVEVLARKEDVFELCEILRKKY